MVNVLDFWRCWMQVLTGMFHAAVVPLQVGHVFKKRPVGKIYRKSMVSTHQIHVFFL